MSASKLFSRQRNLETFLYNSPLSLSFHFDRLFSHQSLNHHAISTTSLEVYSTLQWPRTGLYLPSSKSGTSVVLDAGQATPSISTSSRALGSSSTSLLFPLQHFPFRHRCCSSRSMHSQRTGKSCLHADTTWRGAWRMRTANVASPELN